MENQIKPEQPEQPSLKLLKFRIFTNYGALPVFQIPVSIKLFEEIEGEQCRRVICSMLLEFLCANANIPLNKVQNAIKDESIIQPLTLKEVQPPNITAGVTTRIFQVATPRMLVDQLLAFKITPFMDIRFCVEITDVKLEMSNIKN